MDDLNLTKMILDVWDFMDPLISIPILLVCGLITVGIKAVFISVMLRYGMTGRPVDIMFLQDLVGCSSTIGKII